MMYKSLMFVAGLVSTSGLFFSNDTEHQLFMWNQFKQEYQRTYNADEEARRFKIFVQNLKTIDARNALEKERVHGITKFSDLSQEEFEAMYLGAMPELKRGVSAGNNVNNVEYTGSQSSVDWSGIYTTPVKDQGYCGSCWAFSATEQIESDSMRVLKTSYILSPEQVTQCTKGAFGCGGGWTESAYSYVKTEGGLETNSDYPYTSYYGQTGTCSAVKSKEVIGITGYTTVSGETNMANYVLSTGPLSVCLDANNWNSYTGGIMSVCGKQVDHCVQAVGVNTGSGGYWKVRNSWGTSWGESGYIRLAYGQNTCDITNDPTYVAPVKA
jgi:C1A family cysteine protease